MKTVCTCFTACKPLSEMEREEEKMDDDDSGSPSNVSKDSSLDLTKVKSEHIDKECGPCGSYTLMEAAKVIHLKTIL